jgi:hypothetical protein
MAPEHGPPHCLEGKPPLLERPFDVSTRGPKIRLEASARALARTSVPGVQPGRRLLPPALFVFGYILGTYSHGAHARAIRAEGERFRRAMGIPREGFIRSARLEVDGVLTHCEDCGAPTRREA